MILEPGEKVDITSRPLFLEDNRRHFIGEILAGDGNVFRARGHVFVLDRRKERFRKLPELRTRIFGCADAGPIINVVPIETAIDQIECRVNDEARLVVTDGRAFSLDIHEFNKQRSYR